MYTLGVNEYKVITLLLSLGSTLRTHFCFALPVNLLIFLMKDLLDGVVVEGYFSDKKLMYLLYNSLPEMFMSSL